MCPHCGAESPADFRFCGSCGSALTEAPAAREVRKTVTVLFCDVVGSTELGERVDPEPLRRLMGRYYEQMRAVVERHGGTVEKFVGDAVMAVFGVPRAHEDDALRSVRAAAEMQAAAALLELKIRIGVNTGEVVTGEGETLVTGDAVNVAARLEQAAASGETLIGGETLRLVRDAVSTERIDALELKGKSEPVHAYRLLEVDPDAPWVARRLDAPMVGRRRELERLLGDFELSVSDRACHLFTVLGQAGVGKSRLVWAFLDAVGGRGRVLRGRCLDYGEGVTYWPVLEVLAQIGRDPDSVIGGSPPETQLAFRQLLESEAADRPLVLYFDDLQWAEPTFLDLVEHIAHWSRDAPIFVLCAARPELLHLRPAWGGGNTNASSLRLESLSQDESRTLIEHLMAGPNLEESMQARIVEAAEGNPLFVEEMVAMMREDSVDGDAVVPPTIQALLQARLDRLAPDERTVIECGAIEGKVFHRGAVQELVPERLRDSVGAHLLVLVREDLIRPEQAMIPGDDACRFRHLLIRDAAYESVPKETRAKLHETFAAWLDTHAQLVEQDEIAGYHLEQAARYRAEIGASDPEVAERAARRLSVAGLGALGRGDWNTARSLMRRAIALLPEGHEARLEVLPDYYVALGELGDTEDARNAVAELESSADERARAYGAMFAAAETMRPEFLRAATANAMELFKRADNLKGLTYATRLSGYERWAVCRVAEAVEEFEAAAAYAARAGLQYVEDEMRARIALACVFGPFPVAESIQRLERLIEEYAERPLVMARIRTMLARLLAVRGDISAARQLPDGAQLFSEAGIHVAASATYITRAWIAWCDGDLEEEERMRRMVVDHAEQLPDPGHIATHSLHLGTCLADRGKDEEAEQWLLRTRETTLPGDIVDIVGMDTLEAVLRARRGELDEAERLARRALTTADQTDHAVIRGGTRTRVAEVFERVGRIDEAKAVLNEALQLAEDQGRLVPAQRARDQIAALAARAITTNTESQSA
jgi:class 3 adenylate cyclase/tetratricopeptide (TPR) repeat protein